FAEQALQALGSRGAAPVVAFEQDVVAQLLPRLELVDEFVLDRFVDVAHAAHDLDPFPERHDRCLALGGQHHLVGDHPGDQVVALGRGAAQNVQVSDVEHVVRAGRITDDGHRGPPWAASSVPASRNHFTNASARNAALAANNNAYTAPKTVGNPNVRKATQSKP